MFDQQVKTIYHLEAFFVCRFFPFAAILLPRFLPAVIPESIEPKVLDSLALLFPPFSFLVLGNRIKLLSSIRLFVFKRSLFSKF
jgi:hypothetical protein